MEMAKRDGLTPGEYRLLVMGDKVLENDEARLSGADVWFLVKSWMVGGVIRRDEEGLFRRRIEPVSLSEPSPLPDSDSLIPERVSKWPEWKRKAYREALAEPLKHPVTLHGMGMIGEAQEVGSAPASPLNTGAAITCPRCQGPTILHDHTFSCDLCNTVFPLASPPREAPAPSQAPNGMQFKLIEGENWVRVEEVSDAIKAAEARAKWAETQAPPTDVREALDRLETFLWAWKPNHPNESFIAAGKDLGIIRTALSQPSPSNRSTDRRISPGRCEACGCDNPFVGKHGKETLCLGCMDEADRPNPPGESSQEGK